MRTSDTDRWVGGLAEWTEGDTAFLSVAFTWSMPQAYSRASWYRQQGYRVMAGGPAVWSLPKYLEPVAEVPKTPEGKRSEGNYPDAVVKHHPLATMASQGCPVGCSFCIVPAMQGRTFTLIPDFPVRPILCDNNLSDLPIEYQNHIIGRYKAEGIPLLDANSGFEPGNLSEDCFHRWAPINKGPWRFGFDDQRDRPKVERVMRMLRAAGTPPKRIRPYVLIGNEPRQACLERIYEVLAWGGEPHVQWEMKLNALVKRPWVKFDWTAQDLKDVARWANRRGWRKAPRFEQYRRSAHTVRDDQKRRDGEGLFDPRQ